MKRKQLVSFEEAVPAKRQHTKPCSDCPWTRSSLPSWLGSMSANEWVQEAHAETIVDCHTLMGAQCAGLAIYRANVCKTPRTSNILTLPRNPVTVFATPQEFVKHHEK